mmetsp:Transcript_32453/g.103079  ORF Transcript_32453/g.103079 Transcript_32453/m.103079 type:complete len:328 (+) Transcript_32453:163-1146(+)
MPDARAPAGLQRPRHGLLPGEAARARVGRDRDVVRAVGARALPGGVLPRGAGAGAPQRQGPGAEAHGHAHGRERGEPAQRRRRPRARGHLPRAPVLRRVEDPLRGAELPPLSAGRPGGGNAALARARAPRAARAGAPRAGALRGGRPRKVPVRLAQRLHAPAAGAEDGDQRSPRASVPRPMVQLRRREPRGARADAAHPPAQRGEGAEARAPGDAAPPGERSGAPGPEGGRRPHARRLPPRAVALPQRLKRLGAARRRARPAPRRRVPIAADGEGQARAEGVGGDRKAAKDGAGPGRGAARRAPPRRAAPRPSVLEPSPHTGGEAAG